MIKTRKSKLLYFIVIIYMLMALLWWAVLLNRKNSEIFLFQKSLIETRHQPETGTNLIDITTLPEYKEIETKFQRQSAMILGEAVVFGLSLILGIYLIYRAFQRELHVLRRQKNFLLSITHELKSPLSSINLIFSTLKRRSLPADKVSELCNDGLQESNRLEDLFNKILTATRMNKGYEFNMYEENISILINELVDSFSKKYPQLSLETKIADNVIVPIDREGFTSLVTNLLENAYKYSPAQKHILVNLVNKDESVHLEFCDHGIGIPTNEKKKIFDQFYRVGSEETRNTQGTGLGLFIVKSIVDAHQWKLKVLDNNPKGTIFKIIIA